MDPVKERRLRSGWRPAPYGQDALDVARRAAGAGRYTLEECRRMAETYRGGDGNHPLARHRDSMG